MTTTLEHPGRPSGLTGFAGAAARRGGRLGLEATRILAGRSEIEADAFDWRFKDETWQTHPAYRRLMQLYLAWAGTLSELVAEADLDWRDRYRAEFLVELLTAAAAPTNTLVGNPAALKRAWETAGLSILRGTRHLVRDLVTNRGMPTTVDRSGFVVGETLAATPGAVVYRDEVCEVLQYAPTTPTVHERPVLLIPPQIGRYYFMDLAPGRSFVEHAVAQGIPVFLISWRNPTSQHADWNFDTYALAVERVIDVVREISGSDDVNLLSLCAGGILTAGVLSHLAAQRDSRVRSASFGVTLLDFAEPALIGMFRAGPVIALARERSSRAGVLDAKTLSTVFSLLRPNELVFNYVVNNYLLGKSPARFDILAWNADGTNLPAELHRQFLDIYQHNLLTEPGGLEVLGTPVDLGEHRDRDLRHGSDDRPPDALEGVLSDHAAAVGAEHVHPQQRGPHRQPGQPAREAEGALLRRTRTRCGSRFVAGRSVPESPERGGRTGPPGSESARAGSASPRGGSAAAGIRCWERPPGPMSTDRRRGPALGTGGQRRPGVRDRPLPGLAANRAWADLRRVRRLLVVVGW